MATLFVKPMHVNGNPTLFAVLNLGAGFAVSKED